MTLADWQRRFPFLVNSSYATASAASAVLLLALLAIAGRNLSTVDYGRFSYALALTTILETLMDVGLSQMTVRTVARDKAAAGRFFRIVLGAKSWSVALGLALLAIIVPLLRPDAALVGVCYLMGISSALRSYLLTTRGLLQGLDRFDLEALIVVADRALLLAMGVAVLAAGYGLPGLVLAFVISRVMIFTGILVLLRRLLGSVVPIFDRTAWREVQAAALPLGVFMIALNTYSYIDTVILGVMRSDAEVGWYAASYRVYEGLTYVPSILAAVLTPRLSRLFVNDRAGHRRLLNRVLVAALALGLLLGGLAFWLSREILTLVFGASYTPGAAALRVLAAGSPFVFATWICHAAAISTNLDRRLLLTTVVGLAANIALNVALIPQWGIRGSAWATVVAEGLTVTLLFLQIRQRLAN